MPPPSHHHPKLPHLGPPPQPTLPTPPPNRPSRPPPPHRPSLNPPIQCPPPPPPPPPKGPSAHFYWGGGELRTKARRRPPRGRGAAVPTDNWGSQTGDFLKFGEAEPFNMEGERAPKPWYHVDLPAPSIVTLTEA